MIYVIEFVVLIEICVYQKKSKIKYGSRWICIKSDTHDKWFEIICDNCFKYKGSLCPNHPIHEEVKIIHAGKDRKSLRLKIL